jgi:hypothetical protein
MTASERSRVEAMAQRPRSRKQGYRAGALLALADGQPIEVVARQRRVGIERIEHWMQEFEARRLRFLDEPDRGRNGRRRRRDDDEASRS